ncbi:hypothetical protein GU90_06970 [Saccharopolyspora rectivirgula]|uniref:Uncharacterized protein n=1 Tax=Saccharopolyspora rectivirgula TaxID=28042 RepID=A0A073BAZ7_9PSEU|nr:hypothetical protein GU90_06970 [Saccharopolyspora rectivirgula]
MLFGCSAHQLRRSRLPGQEQDLLLRSEVLDQREFSAFAGRRCAPGSGGLVDELQALVPAELRFR